MPDLRHTRTRSTPMALAALHRTFGPRARRRIRFSPRLSPQRRLDLAEGSGLRVVAGLERSVTTVERQWSLPDTVGPGMRLLISGLNPSPAAAEAGIGFARPGNRFWPAAMGAGLVSVDRDPGHALAQHCLGMTDLVKRTTRRADELEKAEYVAGMARLDRLVRWLGPDTVCFVGLAGWRAAVDRRAVAGRQQLTVGGRPVYVMPSTSGLNASASLADLTDHLRAATA